MKKIYSENISDNEDTSKPQINLKVYKQPDEKMFDDNLMQNFSKKTE